MNNNSSKWQGHGVRLARFAEEEAFHSWCDGWIDLEAVEYCPESREARVTIEYIAETPYSKWSYLRQIVPSWINQAVFPEASRVDVNVRKGEILLLVSSVNIIDGGIEFRSAQGTVAVLTASPMCRVETTRSPNSFVVTSCCGFIYTRPMR